MIRILIEKVCCLTFRNQAEERIHDYKNEIEILQIKCATFLEEREKNVLRSVEIRDNESQADDDRYEELVQLNGKVNHVLDTFRDKIHQIVMQKADLFDGVGEDASERLDQLVAIVENQAYQIDALRTEHSQMEDAQKNKIQELRKYANKILD